MGIRYIKYAIEDRSQIRLWIDRDLEDGRIWSDRHAFPIDIVAIRAGEYDLDPVNDEEEIWDIILNEVHALSEHHQHKGIEAIHPLYSAFTVKEAREEMLSICRAWQQRHMDWGTESSGRELIQEIHRSIAIWDRELIALHRKKTDNQIRLFRETDMNFHVYQDESHLEMAKRAIRSQLVK